MKEENKKSILEKLSIIQSELKAPKGQKNSFGNYNYRSAEDILEAVKPHLNARRLSLVLSDEIKNIGDRYYIQATATIYDLDSDKTLSNTAFAREEETKKGMDGSQITGTASSYARKYALNGLFNIDDTKDADTNEYQKQTQKATPKATNYRDELIKYIEDNGLDFSIVAKEYKLNANTTQERFKEVLGEFK